MSTFKQVQALADQLAQPALHVVGGRKSQFSRIGGAPSLPKEFAWPDWKGEPLAFLAQLDLSEISAGLPEWMPSTGQLYFFYDQEQSTWGFDPEDRGSWRVIYVDTPRSALQEVALPDDVDLELYNRTPVEFKKLVSRPSWQRLDIDAPEMEDEELEALDEWSNAPFKDAPKHQMFGFPTPVQSDQMELQCQLASNGVDCGTPKGYKSKRAAELKDGAKEWRLLFQLDSDDDAGIMWGDVGTLYFWIREADARRADFSQVWMVLQCS